jgi:hypothetical protein
LIHGFAAGAEASGEIRSIVSWILLSSSLFVLGLTGKEPVRKEERKVSK